MKRIRSLKAIGIIAEHVAIIQFPKDSFSFGNVILVINKVANFIENLPKDANANDYTLTLI